MNLTVVKIGGNVIDFPEALNSFLDAFAKLPEPKILVHGGGKVATRIASQLGVETRMIDGRRVTSREMLDIAVMTYAGLINKQIVAGLQSRGCNAIGLSGADGMAVKAHKRPASPVDYGMVGDVDEANSRLMETLVGGGLVPVYCAISCDEAGLLLNTNADTIASAVAVSASKFAATSLIYCFEKPGVLRDVDDETTVIGHIDEAGFEQLKHEGVIAKGMLPKISNSMDAVKAGVERVVIKSSDDLLEKSGTTICL